MRRLVPSLAALLVAACTGATPASTGPASTAPGPTSSVLPGPTVRSASPTLAATPSPTPTPTPAPTPAPSLARIIGQKLVVAMDGTSVSPALLGRIRRGEIGGVILFGANLVDAGQIAALTSSLQGAAADGGQPPLLVAVDQEGGIVKRLPDAPPRLTLRQMAEDPTGALAREQGRATGAALAALGFNVNLAPVADVPGAKTSFMYLQGRTWSFDADATAVLAIAFAEGLRDGGVVPVLKHFPGIGLSAVNTDRRTATIAATAAELDPGLAPYRAAIAAGLPAVMLSNATYPAFDPRHGAGWSGAVAGDLLRDGLGFAGVTITDALEAAARTRDTTTLRIATLSSGAGVDLLLVADTEAASDIVYAGLLAAAEAGDLDLAVLIESYERILALKASFTDS